MGRYAFAGIGRIGEQRWPIRSAVNIIGANGAFANSVSIDSTNGNPIPTGAGTTGVLFTGGTGGATNALGFANGAPNTNVAYNDTGAGAGNVNLDGSVVTYTSLTNTIINQQAASNTVFNDSETGGTITLSSPIGGLSNIVPTVGAAIQFFSGTAASLDIEANTNAGQNNNVVVASVDPFFTGALTIDAGRNAANTTNTVTLDPGSFITPLLASLNVAAQRPDGIDLNAGTIITTAAQTYNGPVTLGANTVLAAPQR